MVYQDVILLGLVAGGMDIGSDDDEDPKQLVVGTPLEDGLTQVPIAQATTSTPKAGLGAQQGDTAGG